MEPKFLKIKEAVEKEINCADHDLQHTLRVYALCMRIAEGEDADLEVLRAAALLHDIARVKEDADPNSVDHATLGAEMAVHILQELGFSAGQIKQVQHCIVAHRYRSNRKPETQEAQILFDADKVDALGAIGVARSFAWTGRNNANMHKKVNIEEYVKENMGGRINGRIQDPKKHSPQIEFETKLKLLQDRLYTEKAKKIAKERTDFQQNFMDRLDREVGGEL